MREYKIIMGTGLDRHNKNIKEPMKVIEPLLKQLAETFGGYSLIEGFGGYMSQDGTLMSEKNLTVLVIAKSEDVAILMSYAEAFKEALNQESVLFTQAELEYSFI